MKSKRVDNFKAWRDRMKSDGKMSIRPLLKNGDLAELIGLTLGDGSIHSYERTEGLRIVLPLKRPDTVSHYAQLVELVFGKKPSVIMRKSAKCIDLRLYQKDISTRMGIPVGARGRVMFSLPSWIAKEPLFVIRYLRGLYEAEGSLCVHIPTYTHKLIFTNLNISLLNIVFEALTSLGFHPHRTQEDIQLSRKVEVNKAVALLKFRQYEG